MFINNVDGNIDIAAIEKNLDQVQEPTDEEIEDLLANNYMEANKLEFHNYGFATKMESATYFKSENLFLGFGKKLWKQLKKLLCAILTDDSTVGEIIKAVIDALKEILPGGKIVALIIEKIVKYILGKGGIGKFCAA
ncbi:hypothetical protein [Niabella drilacis]|uniref:Uncharacterized protein n=1 Tax=Niabella drilacis (strain DSM 25811 / CCM 8410 / CCUG 62505 / LMG 26954 / E90) TaxID=1285928 RepID=A0A1G7BX55_NIADE|nr:hypothetical protein [Niabella drilacis]SDE31160.1 hypothetical protein SAMN04487894_13413 [Niabella drilacis]